MIYGFVLFYFFPLSASEEKASTLSLSTAACLSAGQGEGLAEVGSSKEMCRDHKNGGK